LVIELPIYFQKVSKQLSWLVLDRTQLSENDMEMMRKFPLALYESIEQGVRIHIGDLEKSQQVSWLIYCSLYGYVEVFERIGLVFEDKFNLDAMGKMVKTSVFAIIANEEDLMPEKGA